MYVLLIDQKGNRGLQGAPCDCDLGLIDHLCGVAKASRLPRGGGRVSSVGCAAQVSSQRSVTHVVIN